MPSRHLDRLRKLHDYEVFQVFFGHMAEGANVDYSPRYREFSIPYRAAAGGGSQLLSYAPGPGP